MHNIKFIRRRFPNQSGLIIAILAIVSILLLLGGIVLLINM
jgi:hypothetical protein